MMDRDKFFEMWGPPLQSTDERTEAAYAGFNRDLDALLSETRAEADKRWRRAVCYGLACDHRGHAGTCEEITARALREEPPPEDSEHVVEVSAEQYAQIVRDCEGRAEEPPRRGACPKCGAYAFFGKAAPDVCPFCGDGEEMPPGMAGDRCEAGNKCGRAGCPECQQ